MSSMMIAEIAQKVDESPFVQHMVPLMPAVGLAMGQFLDRSTRIATAASSQLSMPSAADVRDNAAWKTFKPLVTGALAGMVATTCTLPLDTLKVRVQVAAASGKSVSPFTVGSQTVKTEGALVFYKGLSAGLMRQVIYTGGRFGLFDTLSSACRRTPCFRRRSGGTTAASGTRWPPS